MSEDSVMYTMMIDPVLKTVASVKAQKHSVSLAHVIRNYLEWWVNLDDIHPIVIDRARWAKFEFREENDEGG